MKYLNKYDRYLLIYRQNIELQHIIKRIEKLQKFENLDEYAANKDTISALHNAITAAQELLYQHSISFGDGEESEEN